MLQCNAEMFCYIVTAHLECSMFTKAKTIAKIANKIAIAIFIKEIKI